MELFDLLGRRVALLQEGRREAGSYPLDLPQHLASGVYLLRLTASGHVRTAKVVMMN